jgi:hypothetical protein
LGKFRVRVSVRDRVTVRVTMGQESFPPPVSSLYFVRVPLFLISYSPSFLSVGVRVILGCYSLGYGLDQG